MKIVFTKEAYEKVEALVTNCETEIMGLGKIEIINRNEIKVTDIVIVEQEASSAHVEFDKDILMDFIHERVKIGDSNEWKLWWHSHAGMGVFWSSTDTENMERLGETADWMISAVFNHKMECRGRIDLFRPLTVFQDDIDITRMVEEKEVDKWAKKEIAEKVKEPRVEIKKTSFNWNDYNKDKWEEEDDEETYGERWMEDYDRIYEKLETREDLDKEEKKFIKKHHLCFDKKLIKEYNDERRKKGKRNRF